MLWTWLYAIGVYTIEVYTIEVYTIGVYTIGVYTIGVYAIGVYNPLEFHATLFLQIQFSHSTIVKIYTCIECA